MRQVSVFDLAASGEALRQRSVREPVAELERCERLPSIDAPVGIARRNLRLLRSLP